MKLSVRFGRGTEFVFSLFLLLLGLAVAIAGWSYGLGELNDIGPGAFPLGLGILLMGFALMTLKDALPSRTLHRVAPVLFIPLGIVVWALLIDLAGLLAATGALIGLYLLAEPRLRPLAAIALTLCLTVIGYLVFILGLKLPLHIIGG